MALTLLENPQDVVQFDQQIYGFAGDGLNLLKSERTLSVLFGVRSTPFVGNPEFAPYPAITRFVFSGIAETHCAEDHGLIRGFERPRLLR